MNWFRKNLNRSAVIIAILSAIISDLLVGIFMSVFHIPIWGPNYPPDTVEVMLPAFSSFGFDAVLILANILSMIGFAWILAQKNPAGYTFYSSYLF